jgi:hypothetical protein
MTKQDLVLNEFVICTVTKFIETLWLVVTVKVKVKCTLVQALRLCTGRRPIGGVEV